MWGGGGRLILMSRFLQRNRLKLLQFRHFSITTGRFGFLSENYDCQSAWERRLDSQLLKKLDLDDFFHEVEKKYVTEKFISAIDVDLFVNKVTEEDNLEEMEELAYRLRKSSVTHETLPSTSYAIIRSFFTFDKMDDLIRILNDRLNYGIFPDHYTSSLLMDTFLARKNFRDAAKMASFLMLDEDFGPPTTKLFALLSCLKHIEGGVPDSWDTDTAVEIVKEPGKKEKKPEEERVRVRRLRNVFFDDHFDLTNPQYIVGKTLAYLSFHLKEDEVLRRSIELLGWAMYDKWDKVDNALKNITSQKQTVASDVVKSVTEMATARLAIVESSPDKTLPKPKVRAVPGLNLEPKEITEMFTKLKWDNSAKHLSSVKETLSSSKLSTTNLNLIEKTEELLSNAIDANEKLEIEAQQNNFKKWEDLRIKELDRQLTRFREEQTLYEIEDKKKELREKEDTIFFFDNEEKWMMQQPVVEEPTDPNVKGKGGKPVDDANYVPPQVYSGHQT